MARVAASFSQPPSHSQPVEQFFQWSLLGLLASGFSALAGSGVLDSPTMILTVTGLLLRAVLVAGRQRLNLGVRWITAATLGYAGFYPIDYLYLSRDFIPATVHLICFLAVLRILTAVSDRDYFFVKVIAFLELAGATLLSERLVFFASLASFLLFGVATFCCTELRRSAQEHAGITASPRGFYRRLILLTATVSTGIVLITAVLFFILPRTAKSAFRNLVPRQYHIAGFSNEVRLGEIGRLQQETRPLLHVRIRGAQEQSLFKWRGAALSRFDGKRWFNQRTTPETIPVQRGLAILATDEQRRRQGTRIEYEVRKDDAELFALFFAGIPEFMRTPAPAVLRFSGDNYWSSFGGRNTVYQAWSFIPDEHSLPGEVSELTAPQREANLQLPIVDARVLRLARDVGQGDSDARKAQSIERYLRSSYAYTTDLLDTAVEDPLAHFLCERRAGHCEYFASGMAVMLRSLGIPTRVITGFQSGIYNPITGWQVLRASDAHSWVEVWLEGTGWTVFDPTPVDNRGQTPSVFWSKFALYLDAADMFWQQWVVRYNFEHQLDLAARIREPRKLLKVSAWAERLGQAGTRSFRQSVETLKPYTVHAVSLFLLIASTYLAGPGLWGAWKDRSRAIRIRRGTIASSDAAILYAKMLGILKRKGWEKAAWLTPSEFAAHLPPSDTASLVLQFTRCYQELRYAGNPEAATRMIDLLRELQSARVHTQGINS